MSRDGKRYKRNNVCVNLGVEEREERVTKSGWRGKEEAIVFGGTERVGDYGASE